MRNYYHSYFYFLLKKKNKKRQTKARDRYQLFEGEEKEKARQYHRERSKNLFKE